MYKFSSVFKMILFFILLVGGLTLPVNSNALYKPNADVFYTVQNVPRTYIASYNLKKTSNSSNREYYRIETVNAKGDPLIIIMDNNGFQLDSNDDYSSYSYNARTQVSKMSNESKTIKIIILSYRSELAGVTTLRISKRATSSNTWTPIRTFYNVQFGALPILTNWKPNDIVVATSHYDSVPVSDNEYKQACKDAYGDYNSVDKICTKNGSSTELKLNPCTSKNLSSDYGFERVNDFSSLCEYTSAGAKIFVLTINNWTKPYFRTLWSSYRYWYQPEQRVQTMEDEDAIVYRPFSQRLSDYSGSSSAIVFGISPWYFGFSSSSYVSETKVRIYKDRMDSDSDGDYLSDLMEEKYLHTNPRSVDTDNDSILDIFEVYGYGIRVDNRDYYVPFYFYGADPNKEDIFLEIDYMEKRVLNADPENERFFDFKYKNQTLRELSKTFLNTKSKIKSKNLHIDVSNQIEYCSLIGFDIQEFIDLEPVGKIKFVREGDEENVVEFTACDFDTIKNKYFYKKNKARELFYHYMVLGGRARISNDYIYRYTYDEESNKITDITYYAYTNQAESDIIGNDAFIAYPYYKVDDTIETKWQSRLGIVLHELGHNLGLLHNGNGPLTVLKENEPDPYPDDNGNEIPVYGLEHKLKYLSKLHKSVMNYRFMELGVGGYINNQNKKVFGDFVLSYSDSYLDEEGFRLTKRTMADYTIEHGSEHNSSDLINAYGLHDYKGYCSNRATNKVWNGRFVGSKVVGGHKNNNGRNIDENDDGNDCMNSTLKRTRSGYFNDYTCDCDIEEWQNLWINFWFYWNNNLNPDMNLNPRYPYQQDPRAILIKNYKDYQFKNILDNMKTKRIEIKKKIFKKTGLMGEYYFSGNRMLSK